MVWFNCWLITFKKLNSLAFMIVVNVYVANLVECFWQGRCPFYLEPAIIICLTDGGKMTTSSGASCEVSLLVNLAVVVTIVTSCFECSSCQNCLFFSGTDDKHFASDIFCGLYWSCVLNARQQLLIYCSACCDWVKIISLAKKQFYVLSNGDSTTYIFFSSH